MDARLVAPRDDAWAAALDAVRHDIYHVGPYVEFASRWQHQGTPLAFVATDREATFFVPFIERDLPADLASASSGRADAISPRGFPGPIAGSADGPVDEAFLARAIEAFVTALRERGIVAAFLLTHPFLHPPHDGLRSGGPLVMETRAVSIDLTLSLDELWAQTRANHRRSINKARRAGYRVRIDEGWERFDDFVRVHGVTMDRLGAQPVWRHTAEYFLALRDALEGHIHLCVVEVGDELATGAILTEVDGVALYLTSGTADAHVPASPMKLVIDFARSWARERGDRVLNLGGSPPGADDLIHWKLGFSPLLHEVHSWRVISDPAAYTSLVEGWRARGGDADPAADDPAAGFFPAYRRPVTPR
jgi:hypothetical protein